MKRRLSGALMPPTMACIVAEQFRRTKRCDRFFYENDLTETRFKPSEYPRFRNFRIKCMQIYLT